VRHVQTFHIESNGWNDIGYSFLVGGDGSVYEGRGWDTEGAFAYGYNRKAIGIAFIGTFIKELPVPKQILAGKQLIEEGVTKQKISADYKLLAHRQVSATESPGQAFFELLKTWPHWAKEP
jgi:N-acetylmuramoyl-L-alanine amidase